MTLYDALGRAVRTVEEGRIAPEGRHELLLRGLELPSGTYLLRFEAAPNVGRPLTATRMLSIVR